MTLTWEVFSGPWRTGRLLSKTIQPAHSFLVAYADNLAAINGARVLTVTTLDITNTARNMTNSPFSWAATAGTDTIGLVVGTGTSANTTGTYKLDTKIANGSGAGQLQYGVSACVDPVTSGSNRQFTTARTWTNSSGGAITVNEVGGYAYPNSTFYYCGIRDLSTKLIANLASATATYTTYIVVS